MKTVMWQWHWKALFTVWITGTSSKSERITNCVYTVRQTLSFMRHGWFHKWNMNNGNCSIFFLGFRLSPIASRSHTHSSFCHGTLFLKKMYGSEWRGTGWQQGDNKVPYVEWDDVVYWVVSCKTKYYYLYTNNEFTDFKRYLFISQTSFV